MSPVKVFAVLERVTCVVPPMVSPTVPVATVPVITPVTVVAPAPLRVRALAPLASVPPSVSRVLAPAVRVAAPVSVALPKVMPPVPLVTLLPAAVVSVCAPMDSGP